MDDRVKITRNVVKEVFEKKQKLGRILLVENYDVELFNFFFKKSSEIFIWNRFFSTELASNISLESEILFDIIIIRLPKSHASFDMILNIISGMLANNAKIIIYGMTDEGIKGARKKMKSFFGNIETVLFKKRCYVVMSKPEIEFDKKYIHDFKVNTVLQYKDISVDMEFYPGMFAFKKLDVGTKVLLDSLLDIIEDTQSILDYGCGSAIIGVILRKYLPNIKYSGLDIDSISLLAAKKNISNAYFIFNDSMNFDETKKYDVIVSNPPMHTEKIEHTKIIEHIIENSPKFLAKNGKFIIVVQSRLKLEKHFKKHFKNYAIINSTNQFSVYLGSK